MVGASIRSFSGPHFSAFGLNTERYGYFSVFSPNAGKCGPEKQRIQTLFTQRKVPVILWLCGDEKQCLQEVVISWYCESGK